MLKVIYVYIVFAKYIELVKKKDKQDLFVFAIWSIRQGPQIFSKVVNFDLYFLARNLHQTKILITV